MNAQLPFHWAAAAKKGDLSEIRRFLEDQGADVNSGPEVGHCVRRVRFRNSRFE